MGKAGFGNASTATLQSVSKLKLVAEGVECVIHKQKLLVTREVDTLLIGIAVTITFCTGSEFDYNGMSGKTFHLSN